MVRRSTRASTGTATSTPTKHKRVSSATVNGATPVKKPKTSPTKSQYFSGTEASEESSEGAAEEDESEFDDGEDASATATEDDEVEDESEDDEPTPRRKTKTTPKNGTTSKDLWRPGVKTGLGPGTQVIIKKPKARPAGKIPYEDGTIHPNTLLFLGDLVKNNNRDWLKLNDPDFRQSEKDFHGFVEAMTEKLMEVDDTIPELPVKDVIFRIYRDVRFSKNPLPYKPFFSVAWSRAGRKSPYAHYYLQLAPGKSFIGGGIWHPDAAPTAALRADIDRNARRLKDVLRDARIRKEFLEGVGATDAAVVKAFVKKNAENALKTRPKGFAADHPDIDLLRLKNFTIGRQLTDAEVLGAAGAARIADLFGVLTPFITYLNSVVMPDQAAEDDDDDGSEDDVEADEEEDGSDDGGFS